MHIPDDPLSITRSTTSPPATSAFVAHRHPPTRGIGAARLLGTSWYPEAARLSALQGANVLVYPTAIGWHPAEKLEFGASPARTPGKTIQRSHAIANGRLRGPPSNRVGPPKAPLDGRAWNSWGRSFIARPLRPDPGRVRAPTPKRFLTGPACDPPRAGRKKNAAANWPFSARFGELMLTGRSRSGFGK